MEFHLESAVNVIKAVGSDINDGLTKSKVKQNSIKYGKNQLIKEKQKNLFQRIIEALTEPMMLILIFGLIITLGSNIGKYMRTGEKDFIECVGIFLAVVISVCITIIMEGSSIKAFNALSKMYESVKIKVIREGETVLVGQDEIVVGDIIVLSSGDKIVADGRIIKSNGLKIDESTLSGESISVKKTEEALIGKKFNLSEKINMAFSGCFVTAGSGVMVVTGVGKNTELGKIAGELSKKKEIVSPLNQKLNKLSRTITIVGGIMALIVFILSILRLIVYKNVSFMTVQDAFITSIVLIVAAVPEGLPTIVAISLALNMIKLAKGNALIKKLIATETAGAVSIICSDKTGTLTENKMKVETICYNEFCYIPERVNKEYLFENFCINSTADLIKSEKEIIFNGSATECALLVAYNKSTKKDYKELRKRSEIEKVIPFNSNVKKMTTIIKHDNQYLMLVKGAYESVLPRTDLNYLQKDKIISKIKQVEKEGKRIICFAHKIINDVDEKEYELKYDGYAVISDPIRKEVYSAVEACKSAHIKIKMLTGDNIVTATSIAKELKILTKENEAINSSELEKLSDEELAKLLPNITVIARSTPSIKLRVVKILKGLKEVVAVTGDGINDAPAIKQADVGFSMGITGSEITKEACDVILLDDSFSTVVKAISFGRNVYRNLQRFIMFQLSVNVSAVAFIIISLLLGYPAPFNTLELLWINIIMDGPPALTLGLEQGDRNLMINKPIKRDSNIVTKKMFCSIMLHGLFIAGILLCQTTFNFLGAEDSQKNTVLFTLFIMFQLFNAFNARELGQGSVFTSITKNKLMVITLSITFLIHIFIVQVGYKLFEIVPLPFIMWIKIIGTASLIVLLSEAYKLIYRSFIFKPKKRKKCKKINFQTS